MSDGRLIIICGLPGAGKTTLARQLAESLGAVRFSPDEWMEDAGWSLWDEKARADIELIQWTFAEVMLSVGGIAIIEWGTWTRAERDKLRERARALGASAELRCLHAPVEILFERLQERGAEDPPISLEDLERWATLFEIPDAEELSLYDHPLEHPGSIL